MSYFWKNYVPIFIFYYCRSPFILLFEIASKNKDKIKINILHRNNIAIMNNVELLVKGSSKY
jgi:hypothetical protein